jgi:ABC-type branched-subunit amino acid transport system ATPase component
VHGVDLTVRSGETTVLLGANGAGKSTLCAMIAGIVPVTSGAVWLRGQDVTTMAGHLRSRRGVVLAPESRGVFPSLTVEENLRMWLTTPAERDEAYERFPLLQLRRRLSAGHLSGGEQQMLTLAPVLVRPPAVLVADEPTLGLAPRVVGEVLALIDELRVRGVAVLLVEEKGRDVLAFAQRVALLDLGRVQWEGPRSEVDEDQLQQLYLAGGHRSELKARDGG